MLSAADRPETTMTDHGLMAGPNDGAETRARSLHVTNGDATVPGLRGTGLASVVLSWRDVLHEGPVPDVPDDELRLIRAAFLAGGPAHAAGTATAFAERDRTFAAYRDREYVLWFEADLYDQLQLVQILARLSDLAVPPDRITLICIGEYPGIAHFGGLGELTSAQLRGLPSVAATPLTADALDYATRSWAALRAPDPHGIGVIATTPSPQLRFVAEAFDRLAREYPSTRDGLSLTERRILAAVGEGSPTAATVFVRSSAREVRPFLGDTWCFDRVSRLAAAPAPLVAVEPSGTPVDRDARIRLTDAGRRTLGGDDDHVGRNGIDRWIGGVHLTGHAVPWRWDDGTESLVSTVG
jgi:hypothetical protein